MKQSQLIAFFRHVAAREATYGIQNAFRFKSVLSGRKKGALLPAQYRAGAGAGADAGTSDNLNRSNPVSKPAPGRPARGGPEPKGPAPAEPAPLDTLRPATGGPAHVSVEMELSSSRSHRLQTSDLLLALEEAKKWGVSGNRRRR